MARKRNHLLLSNAPPLDERAAALPDVKRPKPPQLSLAAIAEVRRDRLKRNLKKQATQKALRDDDKLSAGSELKRKREEEEAEKIRLRRA
jgi:hypothetical protein